MNLLTSFVPFAFFDVSMLLDTSTSSFHIDYDYTYLGEQHNNFSDSKLE